MQIIGKYTHAVVYADSIDAGSEGLLLALCNSPAAEGSKIRVMPDVHAGKGCVVGLTMTVGDRVAPALIGGDIGCGVDMYKADAKRLDLQKLDKLIHEKIPAGFYQRKNLHRFSDEAELSKLYCSRHIRENRALLSIGTLGGGNHFIELDKNSSGEYLLIIHSGSRHLGVEVEKYYHDEAFKATGDHVPYELAYVQGELLERYLHDMKIVQDFAALNRRAIADEIIKGMKFDVTDSFSTVHNYIDTESRILRKGAVSAKAGERLIIPLNMRDGCLVCVGKGNDEWNYSSPHGTGRTMSRTEALNSYTLSQYKKEMSHIYSTTVSRETLDECPMAYKPPQSITDRLGETAEIIEHTIPVYNFKAENE